MTGRFARVVDHFWAARVAHGDAVRRGVAVDSPGRYGDLLFYLPRTGRRALLAEDTPLGVRLLGPADQDSFARFHNSATPTDVDDAYVELDHWLVVGAFVGDRLVSAASAYPWRGSALADIGVLTLATDRGQGHGRRVVRALARQILADRFEPQYRCQPANAASAALAVRSGFELYGTWEPAREV